MRGRAAGGGGLAWLGPGPDGNGGWMSFMELVPGCAAVTMVGGDGRYASESLLPDPR